jgi:predicted 3-demethylubiquinone-9 3-methyltransferase (glyoxalase superfamily)
MTNYNVKLKIQFRALPALRHYVALLDDAKVVSIHKIAKRRVQNRGILNVGLHF